MRTKVGFSILAALMLSSLGESVGHAQQSDIGFFITSAGPGKGGDLGGIAGASSRSFTTTAAPSRARRSATC